MLSIEEVSHTDQAAARHWAAVVNSVRGHDMPGYVPLTPRQVLLWGKHPRPGSTLEHYLAYADEEPVGMLELTLPMLDNVNSVFCSIEVVPSWRRRGIGRKLYDLLVERAKAAGRGTMMSGTVWSLPGIEAHDGGAGPAFAEAMGFESANLPEIIRRLDMSTLDDAALDALYARAIEASPGYRLVQWTGRAPQELVDDIAYLDGRLIEDAPMGDLAIEPEKVDATRVRAVEETAIRRGLVAHNSGAVHEESGRLVAWTCLATNAEIEWRAWQNITIVEPNHRGHRLGALVKVGNLRMVQRAVPSLRFVDTGNAAVNSYMIAINEQMGFRPVWALQNWQRQV